MFLDVEINDSSLVSFECHPVPNFNKCHVNNPNATLEFRQVGNLLLSNWPLNIMANGMVNARTYENNIIAN